MGRKLKRIYKDTHHRPITTFFGFSHQRQMSLMKSAHRGNKSNGLIFKMCGLGPLFHVKKRLNGVHRFNEKNVLRLEIFLRERREHRFLLPFESSLKEPHIVLKT